MSWSVNFIGKPESICKALDEQGAKMDGQSKKEYDAALPSIKTLLSENINNGVIELEANGHACFNDEEKTYGQLHIAIKPLSGALV